MNIQFSSLEACSSARGLVVAVDVVRAFTTAAFAFAAGARRVLLAGTVEEGFALRDRFPGALLMGESGGRVVEGFDLWNSPVQAARVDLGGKTLVQRTSAGTQGIVRAAAAERLFAASFVVAGATARAIQRLDPPEVTFIITGELPAQNYFAPEDRACAAYIAALLQGDAPDPRDYMGWADTFLEVRLGSEPEEIRRAFAEDLVLCAQTDRFPFALEVKRQDGLLVMEKSL